MDKFYGPITKTLVNATPTILVDTTIVQEWYVEVLYEFAGEEENNLPAWSITYSYTTDVIELDKTINQYTKQELINMIPLEYENRIFHDHYEAFLRVNNIKSEKINDFSIDQLS